MARKFGCSRWDHQRFGQNRTKSIASLATAMKKSELAAALEQQFHCWRRSSPWQKQNNLKSTLKSAFTFYYLTMAAYSEATTLK